MSLKKALRGILNPLRKALGRLVILPEPEDGNFVGEHGCVHTGASFITWNQVEGDYLEFGVYEGASFARAYQAIQGNRRRHVQVTTNVTPEYARWRDSKPRFFAFDSFEGLPESDDKQVDYGAGAYQCSEEGFRSNIQRQGVNLADVVTVRGFYDRSLTPQVKAQHGLRRVAMAMIDCDLYESTVPVLNFLTDIVGQGTVLIFHDWFRFQGSPDHGEQRACREWLEANPHLELIEYWREGPQAVSFLVNIRASAPPDRHISK